MPRIDSVLTKEEIHSRDRTFDKNRIYFAEVMDTRDPLHAGRIKVWVMGQDIPKNDSTRWIIARHISSYYGNAPIPTSGGNLSVTSYGANDAIPYTGTIVAIFFPLITAENVSPYWFGCPIDDIVNVNMQGMGGNPPKLEQNPNLPKSEPTVFEPLDEAIKEQGLEKDKVRGYSTARLDRGDFPTSTGSVSPLGNTITNDDGWSPNDPVGTWDSDPKNNVLTVNKIEHSKVPWNSNIRNPDQNTRYYGGHRFRTRSGTQILISDSGLIYMINKDGTAWVELSDDGYIDCYSKTGINARSEGDINLYSDKSVNIEAGENINLYAGSNFCISASQTTIDSSVVLPKPVVSNDISGNSANFNTLYSTQAQLIGTFAGTLQGTAYMAMMPAIDASPVQYPTIPELTITKEYTMPQYSVDNKIGDDKLVSNNTRVPTHEPYAGHDLNQYIKEASVTKGKK